jgi:hypothetical protein
MRDKEHRSPPSLSPGEPGRDLRSALDGRTTLLSRCAGGEVAAVIDVTDAFDPVSATQAGVVLSELLWVRCGSPARQGRSLTAVEQALGAADLLLQSGGFGMLVLDFGNVSAREMQRIPLSAWFRWLTQPAGHFDLTASMARSNPTSPAPTPNSAISTAIRTPLVKGSRLSATLNTTSSASAPP